MDSKVNSNLQSPTSVFTGHSDMSFSREVPFLASENLPCMSSKTQFRRSYQDARNSESEGFLVVMTDCLRRTSTPYPEVNSRSCSIAFPAERCICLSLGSILPRIRCLSIWPVAKWYLSPLCAVYLKIFLVEKR